MEQGPVTVIGGAGRVGRRIVRRLLERGVPVRVTSQDVRRAGRTVPDGVPLEHADVRDAATLAGPLDGCRAVVFSVEPGSASRGPDRPETTMFQGVRNVLDAAGAAHLVLVSQIYVTRSDHPMNGSGRLLDWRLAGEDLIRAGGSPYTIVRPSWLTDTRGSGQAVRLEQGDTGDGRISREDVADACVHALWSSAAIGTTFEIYNVAGPSDTNWDQLFAQLRPDPEGTGSTIRARQNGGR
ncbi:NAD(P)H-binding protein [Micromonospora sp. NBS 11-29]|uniref:NAD(P)H-binding protein n=1 Tax=Micromonospora sp. NBS 11-29 TaxID=1960879 RepID=UPI001C38ACAE|nr:NAD(P)H-binding protein [Micromonospora sp. NBS 11-29]